MYLKKYINFNIFKFNFSISQHVVCLHLFDLFTYLISLHWKIESEIAWDYSLLNYKSMVENYKIRQRSSEGVSL